MKKVTLGLLLAGLVLPVFVFAQSSTVNLADLQAQIQSLLAQIEQLKAQLGQQQGVPARACYSFANSLRIGDRGSAVSALQKALRSEGFDINDEEGVFDESTASSVVGFQEKYRSEILTPNGLARGTGFVGKSTRAKLNLICVQTPPTWVPPTTTTTPIPVEPITIAPVQPTSDISSLVGIDAVLLNSFNDNAGQWSVFGPGNGLGYQGPADWNWQAKLTLSPSAGFAAREVKSIGIYHDGYGAPAHKEGWSTASRDDYGRNSFPLVVGYNGKQVNTAYDQQILGGVGGTVVLTLYGQVETPKFYGGTIVVNFTDGSQARGTISPAPFTPPNIFVTTNNRPPVINGLDAPTTLAVGQQGTWTVRAYDLEKGSLSYSVVWGDEVNATQGFSSTPAPAVTQSATFTHIYYQAGTYTPTFLVRDTTGLDAKTSATVQVGGGGGIVSEQVKCVFNGSNNQEKCYAESASWVKGVYGQPSVQDVATWTCSGVGSCVVNVNGPRGSQITWNSSCADSKSPVTTIDGNNEYANFYCGITPPSLPFIQIIAPNGGETYKNDGSQITVNWYTGNVPSDFKFDVIRLRAYPNGGEYILATNVLNDGQEVIAIPSNVPVGAYTLEIKSYLNNVLVFDSSDSYFKIISVTTQPSITVLSPNGGESWLKGTTQTIRWTSLENIVDCPQGAVCTSPRSMSRYYDLKLVPYIPPCTGPVCALGFPSPYTIANGISGVSYSWSVGQVLPTETQTSLAPDGSYTVQVCQSGTNTCDSSDSYFKIISVTTQPSITVLSPNAQDILNIGETRQISWQSSNAPSDAYMGALKVFKGNQFLYDIIPTSSRYPATGSFNWNIPVGHVVGNDFRLQITLKNQNNENQLAQAYSNYFTIISATTQPPVVSVSPLNTFADRAGSWGQFSGGAVNGLSADWNWSAGVTLPSLATISSMTVTSQNGETWSTSNSSNYPLVVDYLNRQVNTSYSPNLGTYAAGAHSFTLYGQIASTQFTGGTLTVRLSDGTQLTAPIESNTYTGSPALTASCSPSPSTQTTSANVVWSATASGGTGSYTYAWSGYNMTGRTGQSTTVTYSTASTYAPQVTVTSGTATKTATCDSVAITAPPTVSSIENQLANILEALKQISIGVQSLTQ